MIGLSSDDLFRYTLRLGDNALILGQQLSAWCGHAPALEEDIALANVALDLIGQATNWYNYAVEIEGHERSADDLAFLRDERQFCNVLLVEQPNGDYGQTLMRQFLFDCWHHALLEGLSKSTNIRLSEIAQKSVKEVTYHLERSTNLIIRLGDGTEESHDYIQRALNALWRFTEELYTQDDLEASLIDKGAAPESDAVKSSFINHTSHVFELANLQPPNDSHMRAGGKSGVHSEYLGPLLAEMQYLQRAYPGAKW